MESSQGRLLDEALPGLRDRLGIGTVAVYCSADDLPGCAARRPERERGGPGGPLVSVLPLVLFSQSG